MTEYYIVSQRHTRNAPAQGCLIEFEDVIAECCAAHILTPRLGRKSLRQKLLKPKGDLAFFTEVPPRTTNDT